MEPGSGGGMARQWCTDCGGEYPPHLMDFDHVNETRVDTICGMRMLNRRTQNHPG
jgi:hypothetical protein